MVTIIANLLICGDSHFCSSVGGDKMAVFTVDVTRLIEQINSGVAAVSVSIAGVGSS